MTFHDSAVTCPWCHTKQDAATNVGDSNSPPETGDVTLCIDCGRWSVYQYDSTLRKPTKAEIRQYTQNPDMRRAWTAWFMTVKKDMRKEPMQ